MNITLDSHLLDQIKLTIDEIFMPPGSNIDAVSTSRVLAKALFKMSSAKRCCLEDAAKSLTACQRYSHDDHG